MTDLWQVEAGAADVHRTAVVWEQHACLPLKPGTSLEPLERYRRSGAALVSLNVGYGPSTAADAVKVLASFRSEVLRSPERYVLAETADDARRAAEDRHLAVTFDLEGTVSLDGELAMVEAYYALGVRTMLIAYNDSNAAGGGCHSNPEDGLTRYGRDVVREMNRVGMVVDGSHCSLRTTFDLFEASEAPVILSHSNPRALHEHPRNVTDDQIRGCAATGGVVGINGIGIFLGDNDTSTDTFVRAIEYVCELVGPEHVGIGLDFVFDKDDLAAEFADKSNTFPDGFGYSVDGFDFVEPERLPLITEALLARGIGADDVRAILGGNFLRVAQASWR
jgi:membrane dipeptidase